MEGWIVKRLKRLKRSRVGGCVCVKAPDLDGITVETLKYGGETVVEWICLICDFAWRQRRTR